ncbi:hypothetical protein DV736_g483, partial [Chaetothyriales sp. CBS 134916]
MDFPVLNKCPGYNLYIGGFIALRRPKALQNCHITHIVSVLEWQFQPDNPLTRGYQHLHIPVDDVEDENLLIWFPRSNAFIHDALVNSNPTKVPSRSETSTTNPDVRDTDPGNGVLIHWYVLFLLHAAFEFFCPSLRPEGVVAPHEDGFVSISSYAMGKSRSATILLAYLLWQSRQPSAISPTADINDDSMVSIPAQPFSVVDALVLLRQGRPIAEPNQGFMDQLHLYVDMGCPTTQPQLENHKLYRRWMNKRNVEESLRINRAPDMVDIRFEDEDSPPESEVQERKQASGSAHTAHLSLASESPSSSESNGNIVPEASASTSTSDPAWTEPEIAIKCRRCRHPLARSTFTIPHAPYKSDPSVYIANDHDSSIGACAHIFLHPLSWMRETLSEGQLEGRLTCPNKKCRQNVGKFAWQGLRCSCGKWMTPAFALARGRVDEAKILANGEQRPGRPDPGAGGLGGRVAGVRLPPAMRGAGKGKI